VLRGGALYLVLLNIAQVREQLEVVDGQTVSGRRVTGNVKLHVVILQIVKIFDL
jgi:hypothetical protein